MYKEIYIAVILYIYAIKTAFINISLLVFIFLHYMNLSFNIILV